MPCTRLQLLPYVHNDPNAAMTTTADEVSSSKDIFEATNACIADDLPCETDTSHNNKKQ